MRMSPARNDRAVHAAHATGAGASQRPHMIAVCCGTGNGPLTSCYVYAPARAHCTYYSLQIASRRFM